ncbi:MAG: glycosyltransferase family 2 protein, partial [Bacteroidales bacterium]|nr:glycosyltransferase family 2 protein [Bacteroidales bacterium]
LDADNIIPDKHYLSRLNDVFEAGIQAVQTHRTAKNSNTALATLDAVSEEINNSLFRRGHVALGLSSALIGSAMAFDYRLYKAQMAQVSSSGEDKELEMLLLRNRIPVTYVENLLVLDEKVQQSGTFVNQRARWIANQVMQARKNFAEGWKQLFRGNLDFFDKSIQLLLLPRVLLLASVTLLCLAALVFLPWHYASVWLEIAGITYCGILAAIPKRMYNIALLKAVFYLPVAILLMLLSLLRMKDATKKFVATEHVATSEMITNQKNK